jgi:predicted Zn-dependent protease
LFDTLRDNSRIIVYIVVVAFVISGGFMGFGAYLNNQGGGGQAPNQSPSVIAVVNGMEISQQEYFTLLQQQAPQSNLSSTQIIPFRYNVLNALIERKLIMDQAEKLDVTVQVSESEIDERYNNILEQNEMSDQELADVLAEQGNTIGELRENIKSSLKDSKIITETIDQEISAIEVSDQEVQKLYEQRYPQKETVESESTEAATIDTDKAVDERPDLAEVRENLATEIRNQKRNQSFNSWLSELKKSADITINEPVLSAYHALENENYDQAIDGFTTFVEREETDPIFYNYLARAYEGQNNYEKAEESYNTAIETFPKNNDLKFNYVQFLAEQEKNEGAITLLDEIAAGAEDDFMTYYQLFMLYNQLGAEQKAQLAMEEVQRISQNMQQNQENVEINTENTEEIQKEAQELEDNFEIEAPLETENNN